MSLCRAPLEGVPTHDIIATSACTLCYGLLSTSPTEDTPVNYPSQPIPSTHVDLEKDFFRGETNTLRSGTR